MIDNLSNLVKSFWDLTLWMPEGFRYLVASAFLFFVSSAFLGCLLKFIHFIRKG